MIFEPFPKIARLSRPCVITEKIDGTNAQIYILLTGEEILVNPPPSLHPDVRMYAASKTRYITPENDNF